MAKLGDLTHRLYYQLIQQVQYVVTWFTIIRTNNKVYYKLQHTREIAQIEYQVELRIRLLREAKFRHRFLSEKE